VIARRAVIAGAGAGAACGATAAHAQTASLVGIVAVSAEATSEITRLVRARLRELGLEEGRDVAFVSAHGSGDPQAVAARVAEIAAMKPRVFIASGAVTARAARTLMPDTPTVVLAGDLVAMGFAQSFARPGGNTTGISFFGEQLNAKRLEILAELLRPGARVLMLADTASGTAVPNLAATAAALGIEIFAIEAADRPGIDRALLGARASGADGVNVLASPVLNAHTRRIVELTVAQRLPSIYQWPEAVAGGGLIAYGPSLRAMYRQLGTLVARILRGQHPAEIPIEQPTHFELAINLRTAAAIDLVMPDGLVARADEVIE
jgi:putative tryptophan/tyrosine transport system substrate-binding protein